MRPPLTSSEYRLLVQHSPLMIVDRGVPFSEDAGAFAGDVGSGVDVDERRKAQGAKQPHPQEHLALAQDFVSSGTAASDADDARARLRQPEGNKVRGIDCY